MSKYACEAFSDGLRYEMRPWSLSVHIIEPGMFATKILDTDNLVEQWNELWESLSHDRRADYGVEYLKKSKFQFVQNCWKSFVLDEIYCTTSSM